MLVLEHSAHDGDEEAERFSRSRPRGDHITLAVRRERDGLLLVFVQRERLTGRGILRRRRSKDLGAPGVEHPRRRQPVDRGGTPVAGIDLDQRLRPVTVPSVDRLDLLADVVGVNGRERRREFLVVSKNEVAKREDVQPWR